MLLLADALEDVTPPNTTISACSAGLLAGCWLRMASAAYASACFLQSARQNGYAHSGASDNKQRIFDADEKRPAEAGQIPGRAKEETNNLDQVVV